MTKSMTNKATTWVRPKNDTPPLMTHMGLLATGVIPGEGFSKIVLSSAPAVVILAQLRRVSIVVACGLGVVFVPNPSFTPIL